MTGIAQELSEIEAIALGNTSIVKVSLGDVDVWPPEPAIPTYVADLSIPAFSSSNGRLVFGRANGDIVITGGAAIVVNTHPATWGPANSLLSVRFTILSTDLNGSTLTLQINGLNPVVEGVWHAVTTGFGGNAGIALSAAGLAEGPPAKASVRVELSTAPGGGNIVYDAISDVSLVRLPL
jgi:hypothetical protein